MGALSGLEPKEVFHYFEEIARIPHGSGNVEQISDYLADFAKERGLFCIQDEWKNIIIVKEASEGYEEEPPVILQGHMDMVAVKEPGCGIDMEKEGLRLGTEGDFVFAEGTSLGGDDGIAVAYALALLDSKTLRHPRLEVVITVDEEVGMDGARMIDLSMLKGHRLLNLDSDDEGIFLTGCAGGARVGCRIPLGLSRMEGIAYEVVIDGLAGGHSGAEIHKERGNSNALLGRLLWNLADRMEAGLAECSGGLADNAIPRRTRAVFVVRECDSNLFAEIADTTAAKIKEELSVKDPGFRVQVRELGKGIYPCAAGGDARRAGAFLCALPNGVQAMSAEVPGFVETSLNLGILEFHAGNAGDPSTGFSTEEAADFAAGFSTEEVAGFSTEKAAVLFADFSTEEAAVLFADFSVRSSLESAKGALISRLKAVTALAGGEIAVTGDYPGWKYRADSPLRDKMERLYEEMFGEKPVISAIHAGLECGLLADKIDDLDCVSFGPEMKDIHTTEERLSISSAGRMWDYLVRLLEEKG